MTDELKVKQKRPIPVRVLSLSPAAAVVEWSEKGALKRATLQAKDLQGDSVDPDVLATAIPYGLAWEEVKFNQPTTAQVANALRAAGIWTKHDLFTRPQAAVGVLQALYGIDLGALIEFADKETKQ